MVTLTVLVAPATGVSSAAVLINLDQCGNGKVSAPENYPPGWINGNLNENSSHYREGESVAFRAAMTGPATTGSHKLIIQYDNTDSGGKHAYDYLTSFNRTVKQANPCAGVAGCSGPAPTGTIPIPTDTSLANAAPPVPQVAGTMAIYNGAILANGVKYQPKAGSPEGKALQTSVEITFTAASSTVVLAWGGHIGSALDWGTGDSANAISGSPYHMRIVSLDGSGGNQDRSLKAAAVLPIPTISTQVTDAAGASVNQIKQYSGAAVRDVATLSGPNGPVTGTVDFYVCGSPSPASAPPTCDPGTARNSGQFLGTAPIDPPGKATSASFKPDSGAGTLGQTYCFLAIYTPRDDDTSPYSPGYHTNQSLAIPDNECFQIGAPAAPALQLTKTADQATVNAGEQIGFTIAVSNGSGGGPALGVTVTDVLPNNAGLS